MCDNSKIKIKFHLNKASVDIYIGKCIHTYKLINIYWNNKLKIYMLLRENKITRLAHMIKYKNMNIRRHFGKNK